MGQKFIRHKGQVLLRITPDTEMALLKLQRYFGASSLSSLLEVMVSIVRTATIDLGDVTEEDENID